MKRRDAQEIVITNFLAASLVGTIGFKCVLYLCCVYLNMVPDAINTSYYFMSILSPLLLGIAYGIVVAVITAKKCQKFLNISSLRANQN